MHIVHVGEMIVVSGFESCWIGDLLNSVTKCGGDFLCNITIDLKF